MKIAEIFNKKSEKVKPFAPHSKNDLIASIKKVLEGAHFNTRAFKLNSSDEDLGNGLLKFNFSGKNYKITHDGKVYEGTKLLTSFKPNADIHTHYSTGLHHLSKMFAEQGK